MSACLPAHLLARLRRKIEDKDAEEANEHRGQYQVDCVEQRLPPDRDVERDVSLRRLNTWTTML